VNYPVTTLAAAAWRRTGHGWEAVRPGAAPLAVVATQQVLTVAPVPGVALSVVTLAAVLAPAVAQSDVTSAVVSLSAVA